MKIAVTGSIATDHLMTFDGRFADSLVVEQLDKISVSFLVNDLQIRRGGVAGNIAFGLGNLGLRPILIGCVGADFADYGSWLERHGVDTSEVRISQTQHTARFVCTTDNDMAQMASFYPGAMSEGREVELGPIAERHGGFDLVLIGAHDPEGMRRNTQECRRRGIPFVADPSQQLAFGDGAFIRDIIDGAQYLFTNEYESHLTEQKTGWSADEILDRVGYVSSPAARTARASTAAVSRRSTCPSPRSRRRSTRRASATPSALDSWPGCRGSSSWSAAPSWVRCSPLTSSRPSAPRSTC